MRTEMLLSHLTRWSVLVVHVIGTFTSLDSHMLHPLSLHRAYVTGLSRVSSAGVSITSPLTSTWTVMLSGFSPGQGRGPQGRAFAEPDVRAQRATLVSVETDNDLHWDAFDTGPERWLEAWVCMAGMSVTRRVMKEATASPAGRAVGVASKMLQRHHELGRKWQTFL